MKRAWAGFGAVASLALAAHACFYPSYTFDEQPGEGGGGSGPGPSSTSSTGGATTSSMSTSTSGSTGGGRTGAATSSSSSGAGGGVEDCLNGSDDDDDGDADCADSDCNAGYACVPTIPVGWAGFVALFEGVPAQVPSCPAEFPSADPYKGNNTIVPGNATCSACGCGAAMNQSCVMADDVDPPVMGVQTISVVEKPCGQMPTFFGGFDAPAAWTGTCTTNGGGYNGGDVTCGGPCNVAVTSAPPVVSGGMCPSTGGTITKPTPTWAIAGEACGPAGSGSGCGAGSVCQPKTASPFVTGLCVYKTGDIACPNGSDFSDKHLFYEDYTDTRACSACGCNSPAGGSCALNVSVYSDAVADTCTTQLVSFPAGGCANLTGNPAVFGRKYTVTTPPNGSTCQVTPGGGQVTGAVTPTTPTTFCCLP